MIEKNTGQNPANSQPEHTDSSFAGYRAAGSHEVRGSIPLCSTTNIAGQDANPGLFSCRANVEHEKLLYISV